MSIAAQDGMKRVQANLASRVKKGAMQQKAADAAMARLKGTLSYDDFKGVDLVRGPGLIETRQPCIEPLAATQRPCSWLVLHL